MTTLRDQARAAALEVELERATDHQRRIGQRRPAAAEQASIMVAAWCDENSVDAAWTLGDTEPLDGEGTRWRTAVALDGLELTLRHGRGEPSYGTWELPRPCGACGDTYYQHLGWSLADVGRNLERSDEHDCRASQPDPYIIERYHLSNDSLTRAVERMAQLAGQGYHLEHHVLQATDRHPAAIVLVGTRLPRYSTGDLF